MAEIQTQPISEVPQASSFHMIAAMGGVGFLAGILIVLTYQLTLPVINKNKAVYLEKALFNEVIKGATHKIAYKIEDSNLVEVTGEAAMNAQIYACYGEDHHLMGVAVAASGQGFQELIRLVYGYSPEKEAIIGLKVLESKETPGLGDKIEKDPHFLKNFEALDVSLTPDKSRITHPIEWVKPGEKNKPWQIDTITGATISSTAVSKILRSSTEKVIPIIARHLDQLKTADFPAN
ncbi:MAG: FMN-binding protein [Gemmatimonadetes bacterium]|nr:MAG: FMN-binding protein [Gemmatimonadota bacterium]